MISNPFQKMNSRVYLILLLVFLICSAENETLACSMYKITVDGKSVVGCNHDTWFTTPKIWFENAKKTNEFGACFTGARPVGRNRTAPQSGMNERGLVFSRLAAHHPKQKNPFQNKLKILNEVDYLTDILHTCTTVAQVKQFIEKYDHSVFLEDVFIYIDSSGTYLIVEPYSFIEGKEASYVLSNFCPSITENNQAQQLERYRNGEDFLKNQKPKSSLAFYSALSDTMHVCRKRNGDGTLLTSIWDTKDGLVNLYFYHDFNSTVQFNLAVELAKGDHTIDVSTLFPVNSEFERLKRYKTPFNTPILRLLLVLVAGLLLLFLFIFILAAFLLKSTVFTFKHAIFISIINALLIGYLFILATNINVYYFDAPYKHYNSNLISAFSYLPFLLFIVTIPFTLFTLKKLKSSSTKMWLKVTLISNNLIYLLLILSFAYWGVYSIWN